MPTDDARLKRLEERIIARKKKLVDLAVVQRLHAAIEADVAKAAKLKSDLAKKRANRSRIDETHAKALIGAGVLLLPPAALLRTIHEIRGRLVDRDREWIGQWFKDRGVNIDSEEPEADRVAKGSFGAAPTSTSQLATTDNTIVEAIGETFSSMSEGTFGLLGPEILAHAKPENRTVLENWFAHINQPR